MLEQLKHLWETISHRSFSIVLRARHPLIYAWVLESTDENWIIEVKSNWTYNKHGKDPVLEQNNLLKQKFTIEAGYNFKFMIL